MSSGSGRESPLVFAPNSDSEEWLSQWMSVLSRDLIDSPLIPVDADISVDHASDILTRVTAPCLAIKSIQNQFPYHGLFDYSDVSAYLTLVAIQHTISQDFLDRDREVNAIVSAARSGFVPVHLITNISEKNPLIALPESSTIIDLLHVFSQGIHRVLIHTDSNPSHFLGIVSDRSLLTHFHAHARQSPPLYQFLCNQLHSLSLPSLDLRSSVISCTRAQSVLDAMKAMSAEGVSSIAVLDDDPFEPSLLSSVSVVDIVKIIIPSGNKDILTEPLHQFISRIKEQEGIIDGADRYPIYSVSAASTLGYAMEKLLATTAHRIYITEGSNDSSLPPLPLSTPESDSFTPVTSLNSNNINTNTTNNNNNNNSNNTTTNNITNNNKSLQLRGVVSVVDVLSLFARLAKIPEIDPAHYRTQRRSSMSASASSASASSIGVGVTAHTNSNSHRGRDVM